MTPPPATGMMAQVQAALGNVTKSLKGGRRGRRGRSRRFGESRRRGNSRRRESRRRQRGGSGGGFFGSRRS